MAKTGNHGQVIPQNKRGIELLYWGFGFTTTELGEIFGTTHKSVQRVMRILDIPRRPLGARGREVCIDCKITRPDKLRHKLTKNGTGTRCFLCLQKYKREHQRKALTVGTRTRTKEQHRAKRKADLEHWYKFGPKTPKGEMQWIRKAKHLLRTNRRLLKEATNPNRSKSQGAASEQEQTSPT